MQQAVITVDRVTKHYGDFRAVDDLSFEVREGETFAMLGPNGSGKTTTIRMILDILRPDTGRIAVLGSAFNDAIKDQIGYLPEERGLYRSARVLDMMVYLGTLKGMSRADARQRGLALLERVNLVEHTKSKVSELSKGMQQKLQFAVTILHRPRLIIIDEPFSGLDPVNTLLLQDLLREYRDTGGTVVMSTHQMHQVEELAERLVMISRGQRKLYGGVKEIRQQYAPHAIEVEGEGNWSALPGVVRVETHQNGRQHVTLYLAEDVRPDAVLSAITRTENIRLERFALAVPSLNDIFIRVVGEKDHA